MSVMHGMDWDKGLTLILHTPGGITNATETIVEYLLEKFEFIEVVIPTFAMSAGTMISLAANRIIMGRQSQLGPIDPQMPIGGRAVSARAVTDQFKEAKDQILGNVKLAHVWAPILQSLGPSLIKEAENALDYSEKMVANWLIKRMLSDHPDSENKGTEIAAFFNRSEDHKSHGARISRESARSVGVIIDDLESDQDFQDLILTAYHLVTMVYEKSPAAKVIYSNLGNVWIKNTGNINPQAQKRR